MRRHLPLLVAISALAPAAPAPAASSYCSPTGDYCVAAVKREGRVYLRLAMAARYFESHRLCVTPPRGERECKTFRVRERGAVFGTNVRWSRHFTNRGRGRYRATWRWEGATRGPSVTFTR